MKIVIGSAGRRVYLIRWFQQALRAAGITGEVYVFDNDQYAPSAAVADGYRKVPKYNDEKYETELLLNIEEIRPDLFFTLNDFELLKLAEGLADKIRARGVIVPALSKENHHAVADKYSMYLRLTEAGIPTPETVLLSNHEQLVELVRTCERVIVKDRFGSASSGLLRLGNREAESLIQTEQLTYAYSQRGVALDHIVVQAEVSGTEFGVDIVTPLAGGMVKGVFARKKVRMRHGETSAAKTVISDPFHDVAHSIAKIFGTQGLVDVDILQQSDGTAVVIDVNPRFGGGYPFNHVAGADVPTFYVSEVQKSAPNLSWNRYKAGVSIAKHEGLVEFDHTS